MMNLLMDEMNQDAMIPYLDMVFKRISRNAKRYNNKVPSGYADGDIQYKLTEQAGWTDSFFTGLLYLAYQYTGEEQYLNYTSGYQGYFEKLTDHGLEGDWQSNLSIIGHDIGFVYSLSQVARYKLTGDKAAKNMALRAARILAGRYNEKGHFIRAWDKWPWDTDEAFIEEKKGKVIVDSMMNVPFLMWAYHETGDELYRNIACSHSDTVMKYIVREDFSTFHQYNFNPDTGKPIRGCTGQGYADDSCWSRGQAWALYGFTLMYGYTGDAKYLHTAEGVAEYFIQNIGADDLPCWDFKAAGLQFAPKDSSAGAIAASGLLELSKYVEQLKTGYYTYKAVSIMNALKKLCSAMPIPKAEAILLHGCAGPAFQKENPKQILVPVIDSPLIYGDYFYVEAILKLLDREWKVFW